MKMKTVSISGFQALVFFTNSIALSFPSFSGLFMSISFSGCRISSSVSTGKAFTGRNIRDMKIIYLFLLIIGLLKSVYPYLKEWFFSDYIKGNYIATEGTNSFISALPLLLSGVAVFLICKAFQKGYKLQQEEDFTV